MDNVWLAFSNNVIQNINPLNNEVIKEIVLTYNILNIAITPDYNTLYITFQNAKLIQPIDAITGLLKTPITIPAYAEASYLSPDGNTLWLALSNYTIQSINLSDATLTTPITTQGLGTGFILSPDGSTLYVSVYTSTIQIINISSMTITATITTNENPNHLDITKNGSTLWITGQNNLQSLNTQSLVLSSPIPIGNQQTTNLLDSAYNQENEYLYTCDTSNAIIYNFNTLTLNIENSEIVALSPQKIKLNSNGTILYIINQTINALQYITIAGLTVSAPITLQNTPIALAIGAMLNTLTIITPPTLIYNILNCQPANYVLDNETGVSQ